MGVVFMSIAIVTGGTRGIGASIALKLKNQGYTVIASYISNKEAAEKFSKENSISIMQWDASNEQSCADAVTEIVKKYGSIDILVNNAGITRDSFLHKMTSEQWHEVITTNLNSSFYMTRPVIEAMRQKNFGRIIMISSINGLKGQMGQTNYCASKAGVIGFVKALALENASKGITVNAVAPGYIQTDMVSAMNSEIAEQIKRQIPMGRFGTPEEVADAVQFLCSKSAGFITGETLNINGGQYL